MGLVGTLLVVASETAMSEAWSETAKPAGSPAEVLNKFLDEVIEFLEPERAATLDLPSDELHQEILLPLLPALLGEKVIRQYWREAGTGFFAGLRAHLEGDGERPEWSASDFEIHVTASYAAGADAKALADTLLSEEPLRELTAGLMNRLTGPAWDELPKAVVVHEPVAMVEVEAAVPVAAEAAVESGPELATMGAEDVEVGAGAAKEALPPRVREVALRPQPWDSRRNPIRGQCWRGTGLASWTGTNPLERRGERGRIWQLLGGL